MTDAETLAAIQAGTEEAEDWLASIYPLGRTFDQQDMLFAFVAGRHAALAMLVQAVREEQAR